MILDDGLEVRLEMAKEMPTTSESSPKLRTTLVGNADDLVFGV